MKHKRIVRWCVVENKREQAGPVYFIQLNPRPARAYFPTFEIEK